MILGIDPIVDFAFKRVFGDQRNADILIHLLNAILKLAVPIVSIEILNPFNDKDFSEDKLTVLDVKARDQAGRLLHIEVQILLPQHFRARVLYYWALLYRQQLGEGDPYGQLRPTITICLLNQKLFPKVEDYHLCFALYNMEHGLCFSDHMQIHVLELPKFTRRLDELRDDQDKWTYFFQHAETMDPDELPEPFREPVYQRATRELQMLTKDAALRERYESRQKAIRDQMSLLEDAREEGREQGVLIGRVQLCQQILNRPVTPEEELLTLSIEELRQRAESMTAEFRGR